MTIVIESAVKLSLEERTRIEEVLSKKFPEAVYTYDVSPSVLGGLRVTMGGSQIDASLSGRLAQISRIMA